LTLEEEEVKELENKSKSRKSENREVKIGNIGEVITGGTPSTKEEDNYGGDYPFIRVADFGSGPFIKSTEKTLTKKGLKEVENKKISEGAVMVSCIGTGLGKTALATEDCITNQQINSLIVSENYDNWYIYYKLTNNRQVLQKYAGGSAQPILSKSRFNDIELEIQSCEKQKKIGAILSSFDKKIRINNQINDVLEKMGQAIFKSRFINIEDYDGEVDYDEDLERNVPVSWDKVSLNSIANFLNGKAWQNYSSEHEGENDLPVVKIKELRNGITEDSDRVIRSKSPDKYILDDGDVVFSWSASLVLDLWSEGEAFLNQHLFKVTSQEHPRWFYYLWIDHHIRVFRLIAEAKKTTMGHIKRSDLKEAMVLTPPESELEEISKKMEPIFEKMVEKKVENRRLEELRDALLPKLMSGEIRVDDINLDELKLDSEV